MAIGSSAPLGRPAPAAFGSLLRGYREAAGLSQEDLAERAGVTASAISALERGTRRRPYPHTVHALAKALALDQHAYAALIGARPRGGADAEAPERSDSEARPAARGAGPAALLTTKTGVRPPRPGVVARPALLAALDRSLDVRVVLICAPAGFGKTTLVAHWLADRGLQASWLGLEAADSDPARFCRYLLAAAQPVIDTAGAAGAAGASISGLLAQPQLAPTAAVTGLLNTLAELPDHAVLVLDDYHTITSPAVHDLVAMLVQHLPPRAHLVLLSRADPPLPLASLRARGELLEVRGDDLRFSAAEAETFFAQTMGLRLADDLAAALADRTEGWIAGLQLAGLALRGRAGGDDDAAGFLRDFSGSHRFVLDYLLEQVLGQQPPEVLAFLLRTSVLGRMTAGLCDSLTNGAGIGAAQELLDTLERANVFVVPLDAERRWYRYHHLFADCLRARLGRTDPTLAPGLHRRAAEWYAANGSAAEAVEHALHTGDPAYAARLIEGVGFDLLTRSEYATVQRWLDALGTEEVERSPALCVFAGWIQLEAYAGGRAQAWLDRPADARLPPHLRVLRSALQARLRWHSGQPGPAGAVTGAQGEAPASADLLDLGGLEDAVIGDPGLRAYLVLYASGQHAEALRLQGQFRRAEQIYRQALRRTEHVDPDTRLLAARSFAELALGRLLYELDELEAAEHHLSNGMELARRGRNDQYAAWGAMFLPPVLQAQGRSAEALALVDQAEASSRRRGIEGEVAWCAALRARLARMQGDFEAVTTWVRAYQPRLDGETATDAPLGHLEAFTKGTLARALLALGRTDEAERVIERLLSRAVAAGLTGHTVEFLVLGSLVSQARGDLDRALSTLERALVLAEPSGYVRTFADEGAPLAQLLVEGGPRWSTVSPAYLRRLTSAAGQPAAGSSFFPRERWEPATGLPSASASANAREWAAGDRLVETLTPREVEVLRLVAEGRSNREIAARLIVTLNTAKTHVHALCGKLGAANRTHAVARARELGLLHSS